ncbi:MAG: hypothetical protein WC441_00415 [Patescibacteria group bacterium]
MRGKIKFNKKYFFLTLLLVVSSFFVASNAWAQISFGELITQLIGWVAQVIVSALGLILILLMRVLIYIAQYNDFIGSQAVSNGWIIVRDLCNMFFVVILLAISFATILHIEQYSYKKWLPKLVMMAILINFSKTICGLIIDFGQVIMLTFVNAFKDIGGGNLADMLGITEWLKIKESGDENAVSNWNVIGAYILAVIYVFIAVGVIATMIAMLIMRIMMLWVYVVLSPAAYLLASFPGGQKYSSQWWSEFTKNVIIGPVLAFFIWLSFVTVVPGSTGATILSMENVPSQEAANLGESQAVGAGTADFMVKFIISIAMLIGGLKISQEIGGAAGSIAGKGMNNIQKYGLGTAAAVTGYRYAAGVMQNYQSIRKSRREEKYASAGKSLVSAVDTTKAAAGAPVKGAAKVVGGWGKKAKTWTAAKMNNETVSDYKERKEQETKKKREEKANKKYDKAAKREAYNSGKYTDKSGKEYDLDTSTNTYKDKAGNEAKDTSGKVVKKMSDTTANYYNSVEDSMTKSRAFRNQIQEERAGKKQKILEDAGTSSTDLKRVMNDSSASSDKRLAAAISLAVKEGFKTKDHTKGRQEVSNAKAVIGDNKVLLKKFNDTVNKKFAHLNYNLDNADGTINVDEKERFKQAMDNGLFDGYSQDSTAYSENVLKTLEEYSGIDFPEKISKVAGNSKQARDTIGDSMAKLKDQDLASGGTMINADGDLNKYAKLTARISGNVEAAFSQTSTSGVKTFNKDAATKYFTDAKASWMNSFDASQLKIKTDASGATNAAFVKDLQEAIANGIQVNTLVSMQRADQSPDLIRRILGIVEQEAFKASASPELMKKYDDIDDNNVLKNIPRTTPPV